MLPLNCPVRIRSQEVILVDDLALSAVAPPLSDRLMPIPSPDAALPLYVEQHKVDALSELHPGLPLYGLWQTLIASDLVSARPGRYRVTTNSPEHAGRYLVRETDGAYSGRVVHDAPLDAFAPKEGAAAPTLLDPPLDTLKLPPQPIQTLRHRQAQKARSRLRTLALTGTLALCSAFAGAAADRILEHRHAQILQQAEHLQQHVAVLQQSLMQLEAGGRIAPIDQSRQLEMLLLLSHHPQPVELPQTPALGASSWTATVRPTAIAPRIPLGLPVQQARYQPDGSLRIVW